VKLRTISRAGGTAGASWLARVDEIIVPSEYLRAVFATHGYPTRVIANVVDTGRFRYRERTPLRGRLLSTRNLEPYYRVDNTVEAFALLQQSHPDATLWIAGDGSDRVGLEKRVRARGIPGVKFHGRVGNEAIAGLYDQCDVFVNSSVVDNQPVSVLEAFAAGLPVVSTAPGDMATMVRDGETGLVVPPGDPQAMAKAVAGMLDDPGWARSLARAAREAVEGHTWARVREQWAEVYNGTS